MFLPTIRGSGLDLSGIGSLAMRTGPRFCRQYSAERKRPILPASHRPDPGAWSDNGLHAAWLGHSTVLLRVDGVTILTDPVFSDRVGLNFFLPIGGPVTIGLKRLVAPALRLADFARPDIVLLSHAHMDHFDIPSLRSLESRGAHVITARRTSDLLRVDRYAAVHELGWGEEARIPLSNGSGATVRAFEVNHWGARMRSDTYRGFNGYAIETERHRVLFGGDTAMTRSFSRLRTRRGFDLAIMPIGAYNPWIYAHCTPEQALRMADDAGAEFMLPVHHQTFHLSREPFEEPICRLERALEHAPHRLALRTIGQEFHC